MYHNLIRYLKKNGVLGNFIANLKNAHREFSVLSTKEILTAVKASIEKEGLRDFLYYGSLSFSWSNSNEKFWFWRDLFDLSLNEGNIFIKNV